MKVFKTNAALGYGQLAYLVRLDKTKNGYNYLCIGEQGLEDSDSYEVGKVVFDLDDMYVEPSAFKISESPLFGTFLFDYYAKSVKGKEEGCAK